MRLRFENDNPAVKDLHFTAFRRALEYLNERGWVFSTEDWQSNGMFMLRLECKDHRGVVMGQLTRLK
jgi:hypothetical protein